MPHLQVTTVVHPLPLLRHPKLLLSFAISFITPPTLGIQLRQAVSMCQHENVSHFRFCEFC